MSKTSTARTCPGLAPSTKTGPVITVICNNGGALGDGVDANDLPFTHAMPYLASPHSGNPL